MIRDNGSEAHRGRDNNPQNKIPYETFRRLPDVGDAKLGTLYNKRQYLIKYQSIYQINYSRNYKGGFYLQLLCKAQKPLTKRGRYIGASAAEVNNMVGFELLNVNVY